MLTFARREIFWEQSIAVLFEDVRMLEEKSDQCFDYVGARHPTTFLVELFHEFGCDRRADHSSIRTDQGSTHFHSRYEKSWATKELFSDHITDSDPVATRSILASS